MIELVSALVVVALVVGFYLWYPPFGGRTPKRMFHSSRNHNRRTFQNRELTKVTLESSGWHDFFRRRRQSRRTIKPPKQLVSMKPDFAAFQASAGLQVIWLGHSTVLARIGGQTVLFDPIFSKRASPFQWIGPKRFDTTPQLKLEELPPIDAVVVSHDHYDHLDYHTIRKLKRKAKHFFVPLGLGAHLKRWGISKQNFTELDWWQEADWNGLDVVCTPSQHFSGRTLHDRDATLWASWVVRSGKHRIFFSGDGGYAGHFKQIGEKYGPFDVTLLECGQYDPMWAKIHMAPEQTVQAHIDLRGGLMIPIHWGAFTLAPHPWTEPVERAVAAAAKTDSRLVFPRLGECISIPYAASGDHAGGSWWQSHE